MNVAIIAAAGQGLRMAGKRPKQFLELAGTPIIFHTLRAFEQCDSIQEIIVVISAAEAAGFLALAGKRELRKLSKVVPGGATRADSVLRGLQSVRETTIEIVAVHDAVRPFVTPEEITRTVAAAQLEGAAILVSSPVDTVKEVRDGAVVKTLRRGDLRNALTPQCFQYRLLRRAYEQADVFDPELTDESSLVERLGERVAIVEGSARNIKITRPEDLILAEALLTSDF
ncbi:MAG TPA: 2-C-methyl-D-erythritol 4-phosphate cytidylyltransferase [Pyrinomonadaceae bacterium]|jgi:2-C-methyl-D-erythritol 4-phosphate cytidylyltransferase|nr:2-C-methyl-D-erythritol 4-phosphate cytidylyltransferase [Pyrinomonadaceae bacterium]